MIIEATASELRETGISVIGSVRWGTHFCCFYETKADLLETLVAYFKAGLQNNEFCVWVVSQLLTKEEARRALRQAFPNSTAIWRRLPQIHGHDEWYLCEERCDPQRVLQSWRDKLNLALTMAMPDYELPEMAAGFRKMMDCFSRIRKRVEGLIADRRRLLLCTYPLTTSSGDQVFDVPAPTKLRRPDGMALGNDRDFGAEAAKAEIKRLNEELERKVEERTASWPKP